MTALTNLTRTNAVLLWDPTNRTLIAGNIVGEWLPQRRAADGQDTR